MPVGIELIARQFDEGTLIAMAYAYEQHSEARIMPIFPEASNTLLNYSVPELNNLFNQIGKNTYDQVIKNAKPNVDLFTILTPEVFRAIVNQASG